MENVNREIHSLSDSELSRWIAEKLEPLASLPECFGIDSPLKCWESALVGGIPFEKRGDWAWQPRDMVHDAQMTVMLLENIARLPGRKVEIESDKFGDRIEWTVAPYCTSQRLGRAVAEAFMLAHGYKQDEG